MSQIIIFGYGHLGSSIAKGLRSPENDIVIVDHVKNNIKQAQKDGFVANLTDFSDDDEIVDWGIGIGAQYLFCASKDENLNLYLTLTARTIDPSLRILARAENDDSKAKLLLAGANETLDLGEIGSEKIFTLLNSPRAGSFIDSALYHNTSFFFKERISMQEIKIPKNSSMEGEMLFSFDFKEHFDLIVLAIVEANNKHKPLFNVGGVNHFFKEGDTMVVLGKVENIEKFIEKIGGNSDVTLSD